MTDSPILFSGAMVRAILYGTKTQTRRVITPPDHLRYTGELVNYYGDHRLGMAFEGTTLVHPIRFAIGDRLYVRETVIRQETDQGVGFQTYAADGSDVEPLTRWYHERKSIPSIHMPRWASRLTLTVTDVRVEKVQDISEADAIAEGCPGFNSSGDFTDDESPQEAFRDLWDSINAKRGHGWGANPWVVAITFEAHHGNIDRMGESA